MRFVVLAAAMTLGGCVNGLVERQKELAPLVGQPESALVQRLGVPTRTFETAGIRFLAYDQNRTFYEPGVPGPFFGGYGYGYGGFGGGYGYGGGIPPTIQQLSCETTFQVAGGVVRSFDLRGNACG